jgi:hypothetical protein
MQVALPVQLAAKPPDFSLLAELQQGPQSELNRLALSLEAGCPESLLHKPIVDHNIRSHAMCIPHYDYTHCDSWALGL